ncbi:MAG: aminotransferase class I/II-fold pyridoxal phosphate-dependent enzyme [Chloroflexi bacterium]|nr:aminotransferase class I/II-fold pyridoxal phosphate-dependent enzyme [Chloroflexota bacterium]
MSQKWRMATREVHAGEARIKPENALTTPVFQSSTFTFADTADLARFTEARRHGASGARVEYGRYGNPTVAAAERKLAELEDGESALLFSSGMAAISLVLLSFLSQGAHVVMTDDCYRRTRQFLGDFIGRYGVDSTVVPVGDYGALESAITPNTRLVVTESPTNPYMRIVDLPRLVSIAQRRHVRTVIDSTFATPVNQRPLRMGIDLVVHSATKYLGGHNDLLAGAVIGSTDLLAQVRETQSIIGAVCDPHTAYLLIRGLKTLSLRMAHQNRVGLAVASFLEQHPAVQRVYYPGLVTHPDYTIACEQMDGFGGVVSFELNADLKATCQFVDTLRIPYIGPSLGGAESLIVPVALASYSDYSPEDRAAIGISDTLVRLAVGLEDADDLIDDIRQALDCMLT